MNIKMLLSILGRFLVPYGAAMLAPCLVAFGYRESEALPLGVGAVVTVLAGLVFLWRGNMEGKMSVKEGYLVVAGAWIAACIMGAVPYVTTGVLSSGVDAIFEATAGFTTTGASVLTDLESVSRGVLLWRSMSNWLGGMGVIMLFILLLPNMGISTVTLYNTEAADFMPQKVMPKIKDKVVLLWKIYVGLTVAVAIALVMAGMPFYDAVNHALTSVCTGGFSTSSQGIGGYHGAAIGIVLMITMVLGSTNFTLFIAVLQKNGRELFRNLELRAYLLIMLGAAALIGANLVLAGGVRVDQALWQASFHTVSFGSSTAYVTVDYDTWPGFSKLILFLLMAVGGCASSTAGGMKVSRVLVLGKMAVAFVKKAIHPKQIQPIKLGGHTLGEPLQNAVSQFFFLFAALFVVSSLIMSALGYEPFEAMGVTLSALGNTGSAFGAFGPSEGVAEAAMGVKLLLCCNMLFGRLEIIALAVLVIPDFWKRRKTW
ncbi:MAG: TrkH family potassium uptake protein [Peptococcaceae bacterium]|nr:TrkH family potassium uptake protein [Peptococcaceae bacterium]